MNPIDRIKKIIEHHESEAKYARDGADNCIAQAAKNEADAKEHEASAEQWRSILRREEAGTRTVTVKLDLDTSAYEEAMNRLRSQTGGN